MLLVWMLTGRGVTWLDAAVSSFNIVLVVGLAWALLRMRAHGSERIRLYGLISTQADHARSLARISAFALEIEDLSEYADLLCRKVARQLDAPIIGLFAVSRSGDRIQLYAGVGWSEGLVGCVDHPPARDSHLSYVVTTNDTASFEDLGNEKRFGGPRMLVDHGVKSGAGVIIPSGEAGRAWGVLAAYDHESRLFSPEELSYLESAARIFGAALSLRASERRYRLLSEAGNDVVATINQAGRVTWIAPSSERLLGYAPEELMKGESLALVHPEDYPLVASILEKPTPVETAVKLRVKPKTGEWIWLDVRFSPLFERETFVGLRAMGRDITKEVEAQHLQEHLFSMTAHELRTPLSVLRGYAQMIQRGKLDPGQVMEYAAKIVHGADEVTGLIDGMLEIDPTGRASQRLESCELCQIVKGEVARYESYHPEHLGRFKISRPRGDVIGVWDKGRVGRAIFNLVENAAKYSSDGVELTIRADGDNAYVDVADHGMGISAEELKKIFQPYFRSQRNEARNASGMGLGLTIAEAGVKLHGGAISVDSHVGQGTTMTVSLPLNPP